MDEVTCAKNCRRIWRSRTLTRQGALNQPAALPAYPVSVERSSPRPSRANTTYRGTNPSTFIECESRVGRRDRRRSLRSCLRVGAAIRSSSLALRA